MLFVFFFFQAEDGIRDYDVTGVQTCALPISRAHYVVDTGQGLEHARAQVSEILEALRATPRPDAPIPAPAVEDSAKPGH